MKFQKKKKSSSEKEKLANGDDEIVQIIKFGNGVAGRFAGGLSTTSRRNRRRRSHMMMQLSGRTLKREARWINIPRTL